MAASIRAALRPAMRNRAKTAVFETGSTHWRQQNPHMRKRNGSRGVTLFELCFGLAIVAILTGLAVPSLRGALRAGAVRSATLELLAGVQQTRASSIVEARPGTLCLSDAAGACLRGNGAGIVLAGISEDGARRRPLAARTLPADVVLHASRPQLDFWPDAFAASTITLTICDTQGVTPPRAIVISQTGRVRLAAATEATARHELARTWLHAGGVVDRAAVAVARTAGRRRHAARVAARARARLCAQPLPPAWCATWRSASAPIRTPARGTTRAPGSLAMPPAPSPWPVIRRQRAANDLAHYFNTARAAFPGADTSTHIEFEPAIGPAAPDRYRISLQWRGPRDNDEVRHAVTLILLARPVAGQA